MSQHELDDWIALRNQVYFRPVDRASLAFSDANRPPSEPWLRVGVWADGKLAGLGELVASFEGWSIPGVGHAMVGIHPAHRRRGLGLQLAARVEEAARVSGLKRLDAKTLDRDLDAAEPFLKRLGFTELEREQFMVQETRGVDVSATEPIRQRLAAAGIEAVPFSAIDSPTRRRELARTASEIDEDVPSRDRWAHPPFEQFERAWFAAPTSLPGAIFVAWDGSRVVGVSGLERRGASRDELEVTVTGVLRAHRRRGIARVLKLMATRFAQHNGFRRVYTENNVVNEGMRALNRELGFVPGPVRVVFAKQLS